MDVAIPSFASAALPACGAAAARGVRRVSARRPRHPRAAVAPCMRARRAPSAAAPASELGTRAKYTRTAAPSPSSDVSVSIGRPSRNVRTVCASVLVRAPLATVWALLSDYGALSTHVPNLAESTVLSQQRGGARVRQAGAQSILGFTFRAAVTLDMREVQAGDAHCRAIEFRRSPGERGDFAAFDGVWKLDRVDASTTALFYDVSVSPKGLVPVRAIEWRISEDVPANMVAVKAVCEARHRSSVADARRCRQRRDAA